MKRILADIRRYKYDVLRHPAPSSVQFDLPRLPPVISIRERTSLNI